MRNVAARTVDLATMVAAMADNAVVKAMAAIAVAHAAMAMVATTVAHAVKSMHNASYTMSAAHHQVSGTLDNYRLKSYRFVSI